MADFKILGSLNNLMSNSAAGQAKGNPVGDFSGLVQSALGNVVEKQKAAETLSAAAANGENVAMQDVIQAVSEAELTLQTMVSVRDRAVEAYQEILRMPI